MGDSTDIGWLFEQNKTWADNVKKIDPDFFANLADQQRPELLWIGCSDSRVPANQITGLPPGEVFVHRNIANVVVPSDLNCLSVIQFAVEVLGVKHIIVCGHYGCGGVAASMEDKSHGLIDNWLHHIRDVHRLHADELDAITDKKARQDRLCELNVIEQTANVCNTTIIKNAWAQGKELAVHGIVYSIQNGILKDLLVRNGPST
jgi:carbonic anhydrase|tara:strand:- start:1361 stop:1972 length:612 start_codon:yes stop_codon:yes gene_type:complete